MENKIKEAFNQVHAEEELKAKTLDFLSERRTYHRRGYRQFACVMACLVIVLLGGGYHLYFTPTAHISIDVNPSIELEVNRFDIVVGVKERNADGKELLDSLNVKYKDYTDAIETILDSENIAALLSKDEIMVITVVGAQGEQRVRMLSNIEACTSEHENTYCHYAGSEEVESAHELGLSCGKYKAFMELQALDPDITLEEVQKMTMREIRERIKALGGGQGSTTHGHHSEKGHR